MQPLPTARARHTGPALPSPARVPALLLVLALALLVALPGDAAAQADIPSPEEFFGHVMGADRELARWDELIEYYELVGERSARVQVREMGPSTRGRPFLVLFVSSPENLANLQQIKEMNALLQDPRGASEAEIDRAVENGRVVVVQSYGLHSTEVASSQAPPEVVYEMATRDDEEMARILDETVSILIPMFNPDGNHIVTDWYDRWVGTEYEGTRPPELYHAYIGHDNNRDAFMQATVESFYGGEILFREWIPQAFIDHHQMGAYTARMYIPPYAEPVRPGADPLVWREMDWYGAHMGYELEQAGRQGIIGAAIYSGWGHFGFHWITPFHNIAGMLTESASANLASPLYVHPEQLTGSRQLPEYEEQTTFPNPWPGGWWTTRDIVVNMRIATLAALDIAAKNREMQLRNAALKAQRQTERGREGPVKAFLIPTEQHDRLTGVKLVDKLLLQGVEVQRAPEEFVHEGRLYGAGTHVVSMAQPKQGVVRYLLGRTFYPQNSYTRRPDGSPIRPYDMSADVLAEFMGVEVHPASEAVSARLEVVSTRPDPEGTVARGREGFHLDGRQNDAFRAVNLLWDEGATVRRFAEDHGPHAAGDFWVSDAPDGLVTRVAAETGVAFGAMDVAVGEETAPVAERARLAVFQRYYGGNMDEGWTRLVLEDFGFPYDTLMDARILEGDLADDFDVILLPADDLETVVGPPEEEVEDVPPAYRSGFGEAGVEALEEFVAAGGTLVTFAEAGDLAIEGFGLPVENVVADVPTTEFWAHGSTLRVDVHDHSLGWGMPDDALVVFFGDNQVYEVQRSPDGAGIRRVVSYQEDDVLQSGQLDGEEHLAGKAAMLEVDHGEGRVVLIGFRTQHRAQTHGTFKFLFNALAGG
jgi:hypothetical protein